MVQTLGITSLVIGSPYSLKDSQHLYMMDFDGIKDIALILEEALRIHKRWDIDTYVYQSSVDGFHMNSFDILPARLVQSIQADCRYETDYPLINERMVDKFLTLRCWTKLKKRPPRFVGRFCEPNRWLKSAAHYVLYKAIADLGDAPEWYKKCWYETDLYFASYNTKHRVNE